MSVDELDIMASGQSIFFFPATQWMRSNLMLDFRSDLLKIGMVQFVWQPTWSVKLLEIHHTGWKDSVINCRNEMQDAPF